MSVVREALGRGGHSLLRTVAVGLAVVVLLTAGLGVGLLVLEPGSSEGSGLVVFLVLVAGAGGVLLALVTLLQAVLDVVASLTA